MQVLFVTPVVEGSGETVTALHMGEGLARDGHDVAFLASGAAASLLAPRFGAAVTRLGTRLEANQRLLRDLIRERRPDAVVFADWPLLFLTQGVAPLARPDGTVAGLEDSGACLVSLDHFGFAQLDGPLYLGPPHLTPHQPITFPPLPAPMRVLLPCPMHAPQGATGRQGTGFRYWDVPLGVDERTRRRERARWLGSDDGLLVLHAVAAWARRAAEQFGLSLYRFLPRILDHYLAGTGRPVTVVSVNGGSLLTPPDTASVHFVNLPPLPPGEFETLLFSCDLVLSENALSISLGKAVCGLQPCAVLRNSFRLLDALEQADAPIRQVIQEMESQRMGSVYPHEVFPTGMRDALERLVLYRDNPLTDAIVRLELYGGETTRQRLHSLLSDGDARARVNARQRTYVEEVAALPTATAALTRLVEEHRSSR